MLWYSLGIRAAAILVIASNSTVKTTWLIVALFFAELIVYVQVCSAVALCWTREEAQKVITRYGLNLKHPHRTFDIFIAATTLVLFSMISSFSLVQMIIPIIISLLQWVVCWWLIYGWHHVDFH